jgi:broad specificity phosphatase PhoE
LQVEGGETLEAVREHIVRGLLSTITPEQGNIIVLTHRVICKLLVLHLLNIGNDHFWDIKYDPGYITLLKRKDERYTLLFKNKACHQREVGDAQEYRDF